MSEYRSVTGAPLGEPSEREAGENRMLVTEKVFGFVIAVIAVQLILDGMVQMGGSLRQSPS